MNAKTERKEVGKYPQVETVANLTKGKLDSFYNLPSEYFPEIMADLNSFSFEREAKATDLVSNAYIRLNIGVLINERLKSIIDQHAVANARYFQAAITKDKKIHPYFFLYILDCIESSDFPKSVFGVGDALRRPRQGRAFSVANNDELKEKVRVFVATSDEDCLIPLQIFLKQPLDIVRVPYETGIFISERLKMRLEEAKTTGVRLKETGVRFEID